MRGWVLALVVVVVLVGRHAKGEHTGDLVCRLSPETRGKLCDMKNLPEKVEGSGVTEIWNITKDGYQEVLMNKKHLDRSVAEIRRLLEENKTKKPYEHGKAENLINTAIQAQQYNDREYEEANQTMSQLEDQQKTARMAAKEALEKLYDSEKSGGVNWTKGCDAQSSKVIATGTALQAALVTWRAQTNAEGTPPENCPAHVGWEKSVKKAASHIILLGEDLKAEERVRDHSLASLAVVLAIRRGVENGTDLETIAIAARQAIQPSAAVELEAPGKKVFKRKIGQITEGPQVISQAKPFKDLIDTYFPFTKGFRALDWCPSPISVAIAVVVVVIVLCVIYSYRRLGRQT